MYGNPRRKSMWVCGMLSCLCQYDITAAVSPEITTTEESTVHSRPGNGRDDVAAQDDDEDDEST